MAGDVNGSFEQALEAARRRMVDGLRREIQDERVLTAFRQQNPDAKLIILGEKDLQYHLLEQVLVSAANAKVTNVNFQTAKAK